MMHYIVSKSYSGSLFCLSLDAEQVTRIWILGDATASGLDSQTVVVASAFLRSI